MNQILRLGPHGAARPFAEPMTALLALLRDNARLYATEEQIVHLAYEATGWARDLDDAEKEAVLLLVLCSLIAVRQGSTRLPVRGSEGRTCLGSTIGQLTGSPDKAASVPDTIDCLLGDERLRPLIGGPDEFRPLVLDGPHLYHQRMHVLESRFAQRLLGLAAASVPQLGEQAVDRELAHVDGRPLRLSEEQLSAIRTALLSPFTVISGGPGTGKTSVIVSLLRALCRLGVKPEGIALSAPTGKAANRMAEMIGRSLMLQDETDWQVAAIPPPRTLHRLLGYSPSTDRFHHHENNRLSEEVVIVDEGSMIDLFLMDRLIRSLRANGRLILIGDAEQLPSVEAGAVLRDIVSLAEGDPLSPLGRSAVKLRRNFRTSTEDPSGFKVLTAAEQIRKGHDKVVAGEEPDSSAVVQRSAWDVRFEGVELIPAGEADDNLHTFLGCWHDLRIRALGDFDRLIRKEYRWDNRGFSPKDTEDLERLFNHFGSFRILCITRVYETGSDAVNRFFHQKLLQEGRFDFLPDFVPGEPVLMEHNDYRRNIYNGDQGMVLRVRHHSAEQHFMAVFRLPDGFGAFHLDSLKGSLTGAFAMTVHKSQGSEFEHVALILPGQEMPLLSRELLYTAVTRSRRSVTILGARRVLAQAVRNRVSRFSGIAEKLRTARGQTGPP